jgi:hypothetical protein
MPPQICFRNHIGLPGQPNPPTIDGFVEPEDFVEVGFGTTPSQVDTGWTGAARVTYIADTAVGVGRPLVDFQCLKHNTQDFIYLSFVVRRDTGFQDQDRIVIVFHPNYATGSATKTGEERRLDILPNSTGTGVAASGNPRTTEFYKWNTAGSGSWQNTGGIAAITGAEVKCKSWDLGVNNKNWSVEVKLPTSIAAGGANWVNFTSSFGFYVNVIRLCSGTECTTDPTPFDGHSFQFTWPRANYATGDRLISGVISVDQAVIPPAFLGQAFFASDPGCAGVAGVKFQSGAASIGILSGGSITSNIDANNKNVFVGRVVNTAGMNANNVEASFRIANWGIGPGVNDKWNLVPPDAGKSNPSAPAVIPAGGGPVDLTTEWTLDAAEKALYGTPPAKPLSKHQCIWVLLDSVSAVDFVESSIRRNCDFVGLSEVEDTAEISGDGYPPPPGGSADQEMLLVVSQARRARLVQKNQAKDFHTRSQERMATSRAFSAGKTFREPGGWLGNLLALVQNAISGLTVVYDWYWVTDGYRKTEFEFTVGGKRYLIHEPVGAFGHIAEHEGLVSAFEQSVTPVPGDAGRFEKTGADSYRLRVPNGGKAHVVTRLKAVEFKIPWWAWLLGLLFLLIIWLLLR